MGRDAHVLQAGVGLVLLHHCLVGFGPDHGPGDVQHAGDWLILDRIGLYGCIDIPERDRVSGPAEFDGATSPLHGRQPGFSPRPRFRFPLRPPPARDWRKSRHRFAIGAFRYTATEFAHAELDRLGLADWTVTSRQQDPKRGPCAMVFVTEPGVVEVRTFFSADRAPGSSELIPLLRSQIADQCLALPEAEAAVKEILAGEHHSPTSIQIDGARPARGST